MSNTTKRKRKIGVLWNVGQIADLVGVNPKTVRRWIDDGKLEGTRLPGNAGERRVHQDTLREFLVNLGYTRNVAEMDARKAAMETSG